MNFIFDEFIRVESGGSTTYLSAASITAIESETSNINKCIVYQNDNGSSCVIDVAPGVMKNMVEEARRHQAMKFDQVIRSLSRK